MGFVIWKRLKIASELAKDSIQRYRHAKTREAGYSISRKLPTGIHAWACQRTEKSKRCRPASMANRL